MGKVMTVLGPVEASQLGFTSMHEHIICDASYYGEIAKRKSKEPEKNQFPSMPEEPIKLENLGFILSGFYSRSEDNMKLDEDLITAEVQDYNDIGGSTILELSVPGVRGDIKSLKRISKTTGTHIIASTGLYAEESWPDKYHGMTVNQLIEFMKEEVDVGIEGTDIKAGHLKFAPNYMTEGEQRMVKAIAQASLDTGLSATLHHGILLNKDHGRLMVDLLMREGVNPERVVLAHMDKLCFNYPDSYKLTNYLLDPNSRRLELDYVEEVLQKGFTISIDTFGHNWHLESRDWINQTDYDRLAALVTLINKGYSKQIVIGCDIYTKTLTRRFGSHGYSRLINFVVPKLREVGISESDIENITVNNPARLLSMM